MRKLTFLHSSLYKHFHFFLSKFIINFPLKNFKQNIAIFRSIAHEFLNIFTAETVNDLKDTRPQKRALSIHKTSSKIPFSIITKNPLDQFFLNSDERSDNLSSSHNHKPNPHDTSGITSPLPFYTKRPLRKLSKLSRLKLFAKRKSFSRSTIKISQSIHHHHHNLIILVSIQTLTAIIHALHLFKMKLTALSKYLKPITSFHHHLSNIGHSALFPPKQQLPYFITPLGKNSLVFSELRVNQKSLLPVQNNLPLTSVFFTNLLLENEIKLLDITFQYDSSPCLLSITTRFTKYFHNLRSDCFSIVLGLANSGS